MEIEVLHRQGKGIREISRETGIARNTVRAVLRGEHDNDYGPREPRSTKLDGHKDYLRYRIERAGRDRLSAIVLLRETRARGYDGGVTQLKELVRSMRPQEPIEPAVRFETEPGKQLQIDFVNFRRGALPLRAFTAELGYSRYSYVEFTDNERAETLVSCLENSFAFFGGTTEHVLCDNPKTIVIERNAYADGQHRYNHYLLEFARHYGIRIKLCAPYRIKLCAPYRAQTKGKVERFHRYLRESFFVPLQTAQSSLVDVPAANREVRLWLSETANSRIHATLKEQPLHRFAIEQKSLRMLPLPYAGRQSLATPASTYAVPLPVESLQHPLAIYDDLAREISHE